MTTTILSPELPVQTTPARARITAAWLRDETEAVNDLLDQADLPQDEREQVIELRRRAGRPRARASE